MSAGSSERINVIFGGILPPLQLLHALEGGSPRIMPNKFISLAVKNGYASNLLDRKTLKKIDDGKMVSNRAWNKLFSTRELQTVKEQIENGLGFKAGSSTLAWHGFVKGYHNRQPLTNTLKFINYGIRQEIEIQSGKYCLADAIENWSIAASDNNYVSEKVTQCLLKIKANSDDNTNVRLQSDFLKSEMGQIFVTEVVVSSIMAFLLRYELDIEAEYCSGRIHSKNKYLCLYFENQSKYRASMELLVSTWQQKLNELSKKDISRREIASFMPGESDIDEKSRQLRAWTSGENMPKDESLVRFLLNAMHWLQDRGYIRKNQSDATVRYLYKVFRVYMVMDALKHDVCSRFFDFSDFSACYKRQASLI